MWRQQTFESSLVDRGEIWVKVGETLRWSKPFSKSNERILSHQIQILPKKWRKIMQFQKKDHVWNHEKLFRGGAGDWTRDFPHAKRTLYHWVTPPSCMLKVKIKDFQTDVYFGPEYDTIFPSIFSLREFLDVQNLSWHQASCKFHWNQWQHCHYPVM